MQNIVKNEVREIRMNPVSPGESVLVATARNMRPKKEEAPAPRDTRSHVETCPFCVGNEAMTPPALLTCEEKGDWQIRIVENLYPVVGEDSNQSIFNFWLQQITDGYGRHEVVIDNPCHGIAIHEMGVGHLYKLFQAYRNRMEQLYASNPRLKYVLVFKNFGPAAGASIAHTHSQLIALPSVPENVLLEAEQSASYFQKNHQCIFCSLVDEALTFEATIYDRETGAIRRKIGVQQYIVERGAKFIAIKPFASRYEWEVHILSLQHKADYLDSTEEELKDFAEVLQRTMTRLHAVLGGVQYNYFIHSVPHDDLYEKRKTSFHWHLEICPRTSIPTGFELGSGLFVNTLCPEEAAQRLRSVQL